MHFWPSCGYERLQPTAEGWLALTPDYLRLVLARPEFFPVAAPALGEQWGPRLGRLEDL